MTIVCFEGQEVEFKIDQGDTLFDLLLVAQEQLWGANRELIAVRVDDTDIQPLNENHLRSIAVHNVRIELELSEERPEPTWKSTLPQAISYIQDLKSNLEALGEQLRRNTGEAAPQEGLKNSLQGMTTILDLVRAVREDEHCPIEIQSKIDSLSPELLEILKEINEAQESGDPSLLGDLVEYEFPEVIEEIGDILQKFLETL